MFVVAFLLFSRVETWDQTKNESVEELQIKPQLFNLLNKNITLF